MPDSLEVSDLEEFIDTYLQVIIAEANEAGFSSDEILAALRQAIERQRLAFEEDPDPAEDPPPGNMDRLASSATKH